MATKQLFVAAFVLIVGLAAFSAYAFKKKDEPIKLEIYPGQKIIFLGKNSGLQEFGEVLNNWKKIHDAIYVYQKQDCVKYNLTIDSIKSFDTSSSKESSDVNESIFTLGTSDPCHQDKGSSGPIWKISHSNDVYTVLSSSAIEE